MSINGASRYHLCRPEGRRWPRSRCPRSKLLRCPAHRAHVLLGRFHHRHATTAHEQVLLEGRRIVIGQGSHYVRLGDLLGVGRAMIEGWNHDPCVTGGAPDFKL